LENVIRNAVIVGTGNVAYHLVKAFSNKGIQFIQVLGRNETSANSISGTFNIPYIENPKKLDYNADLYILAVRDDNIREAALELGLKDQLLVHTSGFSSLNTIEGASKNTGVIWPLQTLTSGSEVNYGKIPFFIEGSNEDAAKSLLHLVRQVSDTVMIASSAVRQQIHLAAVIASNLTNHLYTEAALLLEKNGIPFDILGPLINETSDKAVRQHPLNSQTGPAVRNDLKVIEKHLDMLKDDPDFREIYRLISENIIHHHNK